MTSHRRVGAFIGTLAFLLIFMGLLLPLQSAEFQDQQNFGAMGFQFQNDMDFAFTFGLFEYKVVDRNRGIEDGQAYLDSDDPEGQGLLLSGAILLVTGAAFALFTLVIGWIEASEPANFPLLSGGLALALMVVGFLLHGAGLDRFMEGLSLSFHAGSYLLILGFVLSIAALITPVILAGAEAQNASHADA